MTSDRRNANMTPMFVGVLLHPVTENDRIWGEKAYKLVFM